MRTRTIAWTFLGLSVIAIAGAAVARFTGLRPPYWVGCAVGFAAIVAATLWMIVHQGLIAGWKWALWRGVIGIAWVTTAELVCLHTGWMGPYHYTPLWLPYVTLPSGEIFPLALPLAWHLLGASSALVTERLDRRISPLVAGGLLVALDFALEPVLTGPVGFWKWAGGDPPVANFVGWFVIGSLLALMLQPSERALTDEPRREAAWLLAAVSLGTLAIGLTHGEPRGFYALVPLAVLGLVTRWSRPSGRSD